MDLDNFKTKLSPDQYTFYDLIGGFDGGHWRVF